MMWCIIIKYQNVVVSKQKQPGRKKGMAKQIINKSYRTGGQATVNRLKFMWECSILNVHVKKYSR